MGSSLETLRFEVGNIPKCMLVSLGLWTEIDNLDHSSNNAPDPLYIDLFIMFNATFSNISAISWRPVLVVEETGVLYPERTTDHGQATGKLNHLRLRVECTLFVIYKAGHENHAVLVIGLY
jgi:hypothetical protein